MVKRLILIALSLLSLAGTAAAQSEDEAAVFAGIFRGKLPATYPFKYNGTYFWSRKAFQKGTVWYNGKQYDGISLNVDAYTYEPYDEFSLTPKEAKNRTLDELKNSWIAQEKTPCIFISAKERIGIDKLRNDLYKMVAEIHAGRYPFNNFLW